MDKAEHQKISVQGSNSSQKEENFCYQENSSDKQELYYCSDIEKEEQLCPTIQTTHSLNQKNSLFSNLSDPSSKSQPPRSIFHNFQKHLVITLRQYIKIKKSTHKNQPEYLAHELWKNFAKQTKIYTKNILQFVFGVIDFESTNLTNVYDEELIQKFEFSQIFSHFSDSRICQAQQLLRKQVIRQMKEISMKDLLKDRKLMYSEKLEKYIQEFVSELQQGPMRKRLPKKKKEGMGLKKKQTEDEIKK